MKRGEARAVIVEVNGVEQTFPSQSEAARVLKVGQTMISKLCLKKTQSKKIKARFASEPKDCKDVSPEKYADPTEA